MRKGILYFVVFGLILLVSSCGNSGDSADLEPSDILQDSTRLYGQADYQFPTLSPESSEALTQWPIFDEFKSEVTTINGHSVAVIRNKSERLILHTDSLRRTIPDTLNTQPIYSRLMVTQTRAMLLNQETNRDRLDTLLLEQAMEEFNQSISSLFVQINEKFQKDRIDRLRADDEKLELEKQKRFLDSVEQSELVDQNRTKSVTKQEN